MKLLKKKLKPLLNYHPIYWLKLRKAEKRLTKSAQIPEHEARGIALVWVSYSGDFEILSSSIASAEMHTQQKVNHLIVIQDCSSPFSDSQTEHLHSLSSIPLTILNSIYPISWAGTATIASELDAFTEIFRTLNVQWIVKIDSDILFISDKILTQLERAEDKPLVVGHSASMLYKWLPSSLKHDWTQGGAYCLNVKAFNQIKKTSLVRAAKNALRHSKFTLRYLPEDVFFSHLFRLSLVDIDYKQFHFPIWFREDLFSPEESPQGEKCYSILHFEGCKEHQTKTFDEIRGLKNDRLLQVLYEKWNSQKSACKTNKLML